MQIPTLSMQFSKVLHHIISICRPSGLDKTRHGQLCRATWTPYSTECQGSSIMLMTMTRKKNHLVMLSSSKPDFGILCP